MLKNLLFIAFSCFFCFSSFAQSNHEVDIAKAELTKQADKLGLDRTQINAFIVSDHYVTKHNGASHLYLWQTHKQIPVINAIITFGIKNNEIYNLTSNAVQDLTAKIANESASLSPDMAIKAAGEQLGFPNNESFTRTAVKGDFSFMYAPASFASNEIPVFLCYEKNAEGSYVLAWNIDLDIPGSDYWSVRVDANSGNILTKNNYTVYCKFDKDAAHAHDSSCKAAWSSKESTYLNETNVAIANSVVMDGSYRVYAAPAESPNHGSHELILDPSDDVASPFGWHDTDGMEGAEYTITRGNNVHAYLDKDADNVSDGSEPDGGEDLVFDFVHQTDLEPVDSERAAQVNLFYMNNFLHDFLYRHGFDEVSGNFQENNYGNGGAGGDYVLAESADGSGTNNANFATPADGANGRMQMFLWGASENDLLTVNFPNEIAGTYETRAAEYGATIDEIGVTGLLAFVDDGSPVGTRGCSELINDADVNGKIAMIDRGQCEFGLKALNAQNAGAIGVVVCNIEGAGGAEIIVMGPGLDGGDVDIPVIMISLATCDQIRGTVEAGVDVEATIALPSSDGPDNLDASFDNGVIAHELGHGVSNRLTGGPFQSGCLGNDEQMGEGWSDYFGLISSVEPGDTGADPRGIGTYVSSQSTTGPGIRRQRYSTDMTVNTQTFDDIKGTTAPHPLGEVWAGVTWDLYWALVDKYGYDADVNNQESGNAIAIRLVLDGMREQGCNPGFLSGRDGILIADELNNNGDNVCLIWDVFARRGMGISADQGDTNSRADGVENFEPLPICIEKLKIKKTSTDFVKPGTEIEHTITITNHIPQAIDDVKVNDEIPTGATYVEGSSNLVPILSGDMITWDIGDMEYEDVITITYRTLASTEILSDIIILEDFEDGDNNWDIESLEGEISWDLSDDYPAASGTEAYYIDNLETETDNSLIYLPYFEVTGDNPAISFNHRYNTEIGADGGHLRIQIEGSEVWTTVDPSKARLNGYNSLLQYGTFALPNINSYGGNSGEEFVTSIFDISDYIGQSIRVQFRFGTDDNTAPADVFRGWLIDDFSIIDLNSYSGTACVSSPDADEACTMTTTVIDSELLVANEDTEVDDYSMEVFPNPATEYANVMFTSSSKERATLTILTVDGSMVSTQEVVLNQGTDMMRLPISGLSKGFYLVTLRGEKNSSVKRLIID